MEKYLSTITLVINGEEESNWKSIEEDARTVRKTVNLAKKTGVMNVTQRFGFKMDYAIPADEPERDFEGLEDGTVVLDYENGRRVTFTGVNVTEIGGPKFDGENEAVRSITFVAENRIEE